MKLFDWFRKLERDVAEEGQEPSEAVLARIVELLRKIAELEAEIQFCEKLADMMRQRETPWIERWRQATGKHDSLPDYGEFLGWLVDKLDALAAPRRLGPLGQLQECVFCQVRNFADSPISHARNCRLVKELGL